MLEQLAVEFPDVNIEDYLSFLFLRQYGFLNGKPVTEKVFVHSKIMIVDDRVSIVASANFNDRSFLGERDSELGAIIEDTEMVDGLMNNALVPVSRLAQQMRLRLWCEHLGLNYEDEKDRALILDPIADHVYHDVFLATAKKNTAVYERVFPTIPQNHHRTLKQYENEGGLQIPAPPATDGEELAEIRGLLTTHPVDFLKDQDDTNFLQYLMGENAFQ
eukprot:TRINITY_DN10850_c0_g1_i9.p2 TRINITY_DN10850_c0_g1~~TRINITY_DN10850_c0_g1_i9.p2  ORF type:complete len:218 (-),score=55.51 TRINITY_DN10850_c0_g1_i9:87-740(-)